MRQIIIEETETAIQLVNQIAGMHPGQIKTKNMMVLEVTENTLGDALMIIFNQMPIGADEPETEKKTSQVGTCKYCGGPSKSKNANICEGEECVKKQRKEWNDAYLAKKKAAEEKQADPFVGSASTIQ
jgi:hypothetical protein